MKKKLLLLATGISVFITCCKPKENYHDSVGSDLKLEYVRLMDDQRLTIAQLDQIVRAYLEEHPQDFDIEKSKLSVDIFFQGVDNRARFDFESTISNDDRTLHVWISQRGKVHKVKIDTPDTADAG